MSDEETEALQVSVRERPILFSAPMVRAILAGHKTQTRRLAPPLPQRGHVQPLRDGSWEWSSDGGFDHGVTTFRCRYGVPGDRLWVRETWCDPESLREPIYRADMDADDIREESRARRIAAGIAAAYPASAWRPSIHMPRWASRITLELTDVRVQRLQDITEADAQAEGITEPMSIMGTAGYVAAFSYLWDSINGKTHPWTDSNPWVWALTFRRIA